MITGKEQEMKSVICSAHKSTSVSLVSVLGSLLILTGTYPEANGSVMSTNVCTSVLSFYLHAYIYIYIYIY